MRKNNICKYLLAALLTILFTLTATACGFGGVITDPEFNEDGGFGGGLGPSVEAPEEGGNLPGGGEIEDEGNPPVGGGDNPPVGGGDNPGTPGENENSCQDGNHTYVYENVLLEPGCFNPGVKEVMCGSCSYVGVVEIPAVGNHTYVYENVMVEPDCINPGLKEAACGICSYVGVEEIPALGHDEIEHDGMSATCTEDGFKDYVTCGRAGCEYTTYEAIKAGHTYGEAYDNTATCTAGGTAKQTCVADGCTDTKTVKTDALGHDMGEWEETEAPNCTAAGEEKRECTREGCDEYETREIDATGVHTFGEWNVSRAPGCVEKGEEKRECTVDGCEAYETRETDAIGYHIFGEWYVSRVGCIDKGEDRRECTVDGCEAYETRETDAIGYHVFDGWYENIAPSCTAAGEEKRDCAHKGCDYYETKPLAKLPHDEISHKAQTPTCTTVGWSAYVTCSGCDYTTYEELPKAHSYVDKICEFCSGRKPSEGLEYTLSSNKDYYTVSGIGTCKDNELVIPATYNGLPVTWIGYRAFVNKSFESITIPDSVTSIDSDAFNGSNIKKIVIGKNVKTVRLNAFHCNGVEEIYFNATKMNDFTYDNTPFKYIKDSGNGIRVIFGKNVIKIPAYLFSWYEYGTHSGSSSIKSVETEDESHLNSIGERAFGYCENIKSVSLLFDAGSVLFGSGCFAGCENIKDVYISDLSLWASSSFDGVIYGKEANPLSYADNLYVDGKLVTGDVIIPEQTLEIGDYAFYGYDKITTLTIPDGADIGREAFRDCLGLTVVNLGDNINEIGDMAFSGCEKLVEVYYHPNQFIQITAGSRENGLIGYYALNVYTDDTGKSKISRTENGYIFYDDGTYRYLVGYVPVVNVNEGITLTLPSDCNGEKYDIYKYAFCGNTKVKTVALFGKITKIGVGAFMNCTSLSEVLFGNDVTEIGASAFKNCIGLTKIEVPYYVDYIGIGAFDGCDQIYDITLPFIGESEDATGYQSHLGIIFGYSDASAEDYHYQDGNKYYKYRIPESLLIVTVINQKDIPEQGFRMCSNLKTVNLKSAKSIGFI